MSESSADFFTDMDLASGLRGSIVIRALVVGEEEEEG